MLTTDENVVDIGFQVVWNVSEPSNFLFNIAEPKETVQAVSESVMREIIAARNLAPILNRDREVIRLTAQERIQDTLDSYNSGIQILRVNLRRAEPPDAVLDAFLSVQAAEQERDQLQREADRDANQALAEARGLSAQVVENAEAYRSEVTNEALGRASRFLAVLAEYREAEDVTRERLFLDALRNVYEDTPKIILDPSVTGGGDSSGVIPFLPLNELMRDTGARAAASDGN
jgi:membrane protease subunit HflK